MATKRTFIVSPTRNEVEIYDYDRETEHYLSTTVRKRQRHLRGYVQRFKDPREQFFPTWKEAHAALIVQAQHQAKQAQHMAACAEEDVQRIMRQKEPEIPSPQALVEKAKRELARHRAKTSGDEDRFVKDA